MKKLMTLVFALCLTLGIAANASAVEINVKGEFKFEWGWIDNTNLLSAGQDIAIGVGTEDHFYAMQRERIQVDFVASENVKGTLFFEIGNTHWGWTGANNTGPGAGGRLGADGVAVEVKRAFITFNVPNTDLIIQPGLQGLALPAAVMGSPIFNDDVAALVTTYQFNDMVGVGAFWARPWNTDVFNDTPSAWGGNSFNDEIDMFGIYVPVTMDGAFSFTPFFAFGIVGTDVLYTPGTTTTNTISQPFPPGVPFIIRDLPVTYNSVTRLNAAGVGTSQANVLSGLISNAVGTQFLSARRPGFGFPGSTDVGPYINNDYQYLYFAGAAMEFTMLDPLVFALDVNWGKSSDPTEKALDRSGWYFAGSAAYKTPWVTPTLLGWYSTGDDDNIYNGSERMPVVKSNAQMVGTSFGMGAGEGFMNGILTENNYMGTWGVGLALANISFIEDLTHQLRVVFMGGTSHPHAIRDYRSAVPGNWILNNPADVLLTTRDWAWELNFDHKYQMYENLAVYVESGLIDVHRKRNAWSDGFQNLNNPTVRLWNTSTAWKLGMGLKYTF